MTDLQEVIDRLLARRKFVRVKDLAAVLCISKQAASKRIKRLVAAGILEPKGGTDRYPTGYRRVVDQSGRFPQTFWHFLCEEVPQVGRLELYRHLGPSLRRRSQVDLLKQHLRNAKYLLLDFRNVTQVSPSVAEELIRNWPQDLRWDYGLEMTYPINMSHAVELVVTPVLRKIWNRGLD